MNEILIIIIFTIWYIGSLLVSEKISKNSKLGTEGVFFISMIFSPIVGFLVSFLFNKKQAN